MHDLATIQRMNRDAVRVPKHAKPVEGHTVTVTVNKRNAVEIIEWLAEEFEVDLGY